MQLWPRLTLAILPFVATTIASSWVAVSIGQTLGHSVPRRISPPPRSLYVDAATVLCLVQDGVQPSGKPVPAKGSRPAGIAVYGVNRLGIGAIDGDILTDVLGQPVRSAAQVIAMVIAARAANRSIIFGTVWRGIHPYSISVEQPYDTPNCSPDEHDCWRSRCGTNKPLRLTTKPAPKLASPNRRRGEK